MIEKLYNKYFQKSRSFLFPALGIKKTNDFIPAGTYISVKDKINPEDIKLICSFKIEDSPEFREFENTMLLSNPLFSEVIRINDYNLYVFDFQIYENDWFNFLLGKYSRFSSVLKRAIKNFYGESSQEYKYMDTYLFPDKYFTVYAKLLDVDVEELKKVGELCDPCDLDKETIKIPVEILEMLSKLN